VDRVVEGGEQEERVYAKTSATCPEEFFLLYRIGKGKRPIAPTTFENHSKDSGEILAVEGRLGTMGEPEPSPWRKRC